MYYTECPNCGATLDPGEKCDCKEGDKSERKRNEHSECGKGYEAQGGVEKK